jgi:hypothetical protein
VGTNPQSAQPAGIERVGSINSNGDYNSFIQAAVAQVNAGASGDIVSGEVPPNGVDAWNCRPAAIAMALRPGSFTGVQFVGTDGIMGQNITPP